MFSKLLKKLLGKPKVDNAKPRIIKTARNMESINSAAKQGYWPLVKEVKHSDEIKSKIVICQHKKTGEIIGFGDLRRIHSRPKGYEWVTTAWSYPCFESPYAAYLIPKDIEVGEKVMLEDLIENYVGWCWNQGDAARIESCEAIWNGEDFDILYKKQDRRCVVG